MVHRILPPLVPCLLLKEYLPRGMKLIIHTLFSNLIDLTRSHKLRKHTSYIPTQPILPRIEYLFPDRLYLQPLTQLPPCHHHPRLPHLLGQK